MNELEQLAARYPYPYAHIKLLYSIYKDIKPIEYILMIFVANGIDVQDAYAIILSMELAEACGYNRALRDIRSQIHG